MNVDHGTVFVYLTLPPITFETCDRVPVMNTDQVAGTPLQLQPLTSDATLPCRALRLEDDDQTLRLVTVTAIHISHYTTVTVCGEDFPISHLYHVPKWLALNDSHSDGHIAVIVSPKSMPRLITLSESGHGTNAMV